MNLIHSIIMRFLFTSVLLVGTAPLTFGTSLSLPKSDEKKEASVDLKLFEQAIKSNLIEQKEALSQENDVTLYNGASNLCGYYAVWFADRLLKGQDITETSRTSRTSETSETSSNDFESFSGIKSKAATSLENANLDDAAVEKILSEHKLANTSIIFTTTDDICLNYARHSLKNLNFTMPMGLIIHVPNEKNPHWLAARAEIDLNKTPETGLVRLQLADSHNKNILQGTSADEKAAREAVQRVYRCLLQRAQAQQKSAEEKEQKDAAEKLKREKEKKEKEECERIGKQKKDETVATSVEPVTAITKNDDDILFLPPWSMNMDNKESKESKKLKKLKKLTPDRNATASSPTTASATASPIRPSSKPAPHTTPSDKRVKKKSSIAAIVAGFCLSPKSTKPKDQSLQKFLDHLFYKDTVTEKIHPNMDSKMSDKAKISICLNLSSVDILSRIDKDIFTKLKAKNRGDVVDNLLSCLIDKTPKESKAWLKTMFGLIFDIDTGYHQAAKILISYFLALLAHDVMLNNLKKSDNSTSWIFEAFSSDQAALQEKLLKTLTESDLDRHIRVTNEHTLQNLINIIKDIVASVNGCRFDETRSLYKRLEIIEKNESKDSKEAKNSIALYAKDLMEHMQDIQKESAGNSARLICLTDEDPFQEPALWLNGLQKLYLFIKKIAETKKSPSATSTQDSKFPRVYFADYHPLRVVLSYNPLAKNDTYDFNGCHCVSRSIPMKTLITGEWMEVPKEAQYEIQQSFVHDDEVDTKESKTSNKAQNNSKLDEHWVVTHIKLTDLSPKTGIMTIAWKFKQQGTNSEKIRKDKTSFPQCYNLNIYRYIRCLLCALNDDLYRKKYNIGVSEIKEQKQAKSNKIYKLYSCHISHLHELGCDLTCACTQSEVMTVQIYFILNTKTNTIQLESIYPLDKEKPEQLPSSTTTMTKQSTTSVHKYYRP